MSNGRRAKGDGSLYRRADGRWVATVDLGWQDGRRYRRTFYGRTKEEARQKLRAALRASEDGLPLPDQRVTFEGFARHWLDEVLPLQRKPSTVDTYRTYLERHAFPTLGRKRLARITTEDVEALLAAKLREGLAPRTVSHLHKYVRRVLSEAERKGHVSRNVAAARYMESVSVPASEAAYLTLEEARCLLDFSRGSDDRLYALWATAIAVGLRRGEALGLRWGDIDLDEGTLRVRRTLQRVFRQVDGKRVGALEFSEPKTKGSQRTVALPAVCVDALREHRVRQAAERLAAGPAWSDSGLVFASTAGTPFEPRNALRAFYRLCDGAGVRRVPLHALRHTAASLLLAQGVSMRVVMDTLGHSSIDITADLYSHVAPELRREAADGMNRALGGPG